MPDCSAKSNGSLLNGSFSVEIEGKSTKIADVSKVGPLHSLAATTTATMGFSDLPVYIQFHVAIGITAIMFAGFAIALKVPVPFAPQLRNRLHPVMGYIYVMLSVFMPITSNWIWPRLGTPWMVIFFISTMFISMALGTL